MPKTMKFQWQTVIDNSPTIGGGPVCKFLIPAGWKFDGGVVWNMGSARPAQLKFEVSDPNSPAAFYEYPGAYFCWGAGLRPGMNYMGSIVRQPPADQFQALQMVIPAYRPDITDPKIVETENLPKVAQQVFQALPPGPNGRSMVLAGRMRLEYSLNGQPMQEDFYIVFRQDLNMRTGGESWSLDQIRSIRAPKGQMDLYTTLHKVEQQSGVPNPDWNQKYSQLILGNYRQAANNSIAAGNAARAQAAQAHAQEDATAQQYNDHQANQDAMNEQTAETMRDETPWTDADGTRVLLPSAYGKAWQDGNGEYIVSNDPNYDPNQDGSLHSTFTPMNQAPPPGQ